MGADSSLADGRTIVARATPPGRAGIAILRLSGPACRDIAHSMLGRLPSPRVAEYREIHTGDGSLLDRGIVILFPGPHSYTGEDVLEFHCHGGAVVCDMVMAATLELGAVLAEPGEFSKRAFLNDKLDLNQAEAIADVIDSASQAAVRAAQRSLRGNFSEAVMALNDAVTQLRVFVEAAIDFPEEEIDFLDDAQLQDKLDSVAQHFADLEHRIQQGVLLRDGIQVVIAGPPNAGKSSLLNILTGQDTAIVTERPGTTRDLIREHLDLDGLPLHIVDTAGLRDNPDEIEAEGIRRARRELQDADHALLVLDSSQPVDLPLSVMRGELPAGISHTVVLNKIDLSGLQPGPVTGAANCIAVSAKTGLGIDALKAHLKARVGFQEPGEGSLIARRRHLVLLRKAQEFFAAGRVQLEQARAGELMAEELLSAQNTLAEITGEFTSDDLLSEVFSRFCIGK